MTSNGDWVTPTPGGGVAAWAGKIDAATAKRIDLLVAMNERYLVARGKGSKRALRRVAAEYRAAGMPATAEDVENGRL